ncbi:MAG: methyltransferase [Magnetococcales bacterium]|nr:methyltransferase [Magnetococcales bacterium]
MQEESKQETALCRDVGSSIDGRLLAGFMDPAPYERLAELGAGCGEVLLEVASVNPTVTIDGLDIQSELVKIAGRRLARCKMLERLRMLVGDVASPPAIMKPGSYDQVFSNPPFFKVGDGRMPPGKERGLARFEQAGTLVDFIKCGAKLLRPGGVFSLIHRPERLLEIFTELHGAGLSPFRLLPVQDRPNKPAVLLLIAAKKGGAAPLVLEPALIIS